MTKQEEIRKIVILNIIKYCPKISDNDALELASVILKKQSARGVVLKIDRAYPSADGCLTASDYMNRLHQGGYVAVESLV